MLVFNALLGLGTALAPAFVAAFTGIGFWLGLPLLAACLLAGLFVVSLRLPLRPGAADSRSAGSAGHAAIRLPAGFWVFAAFAVLYGICETMNGNWSGARYDVARRKHQDRVPRAFRLLGDGDRRPGAVRR